MSLEVGTKVRVSENFGYGLTEQLDKELIGKVGTVTTYPSSILESSFVPVEIPEVTDPNDAENPHLFLFYEDELEVVEENGA